MVQAEETVPLGKALQRCTVHSRIPLGVLCGAVQELHECLTPIVERGDQFDLHMLGPQRPHLGREDPITDIWASGSCTPRGPCPGSKMETTANPGLSLSWADESNSSPPEQVDWPMNVPLGTLLGFAWLGTIQSPYRWLSHIFQWQARYIVSTSPRPLPWCPWPGHPFNWPSLHSQISFTLRKSSEWTQHYLPNPWVTLLLLDS